MTINDDILRYIKDADFIRFVFEGTPSQLNYWRGYIAVDPKRRMPYCGRSTSCCILTRWNASSAMLRSMA